MSPKTPAMDSARVLVLEDDPDFREMLVRLLAKEGYSVDGAAKGIEALELARKTEYDLVITDIRLEGLDGLATLSKLMQSQPYIGSLVMTGYSNEEDSIRAVRLGVGDYLRKPFRLDDFVGAVRRLITDGMRKKALQKERTSSLRSMRRLSEALSRAWEQQGNPVAKKAHWSKC